MKSDLKSIIVTVPKGISPILKNELMELGFPIVWERETAVATRGTFYDSMKLNLWLRTAHRVLFQLKEFACNDLDELYQEIYKVPWESLISPEGYLSVVSNVDHHSIRDNRIVNLKCKDAVVDRIASLMGRRPDSGNDKSGAVVSVFWKKEYCSVYLDTSGEPLSKRGYRKIPLLAPMQETLAAAVVQTMKFSGNENFINPMCGSGTLAIEAAQLASGKAPGLTRNSFGFMHTLLYDKEIWKKLIDEASSRINKSSNECRIMATDNDEKAINAAKINAAAAGVADMIEFEISDFRKSHVPEGKGLIVFNPEYGKRLGNEKNLVSIYRQIGQFLKQHSSGYRGFVFTGNKRLSEKIGLKPKREYRFLSGKILCRLYEYGVSTDCNE